MNSCTVISNKTLVGRTAVQFVQALTPIKNAVYVMTKDGRRVNAKSILGLLSASINTGDKLTFDIMEGDDTIEALAAIKHFFTAEE